MKLITFILLLVLGAFYFASCSNSQASAKNEATMVADAQSGSAHLTGDLQVNIPERNSLTANGDFFSQNWGVLSLALLAFAETVVRLTPTEKDNSILKIITNIFNAIIPNLKKGGGKF